jgi:hypothetical protein
MPLLSTGHLLGQCPAGPPGPHPSEQQGCHLPAHQTSDWQAHQVAAQQTRWIAACWPARPPPHRPTQPPPGRRARLLLDGPPGLCPASPPGCHLLAHQTAARPLAWPTRLPSAHWPTSTPADACHRRAPTPPGSGSKPA